jgi:multidrug efflux pump subunit AcrB
MAGWSASCGWTVQQQPDIEFPVVIVSDCPAGRRADRDRNQITQRVEAAVRSISGVSSISSTASEGNSQTMVQFEDRRGHQSAVNEVKNAVDQIRSELPDGILEPQSLQGHQFVRTDRLFRGRGRRHDDGAAVVVHRRHGGQAAALGRGHGRSEALRRGRPRNLVTLDPARMQSLGVTASQVNAGAAPAQRQRGGRPAEIGGSRQSVRVLGNAPMPMRCRRPKSARRRPHGQARRYRARDATAMARSTSIAKFNGKPVVTFSISRARGGRT